MELSALFDTISKRKSIRSFQMEPLPSKFMKELELFIHMAKPLDPEIRYVTRIVSQDETRNLIPVAAPHYLLFFSKGTGDYLTNAGYLLQQVDLFLSMNKIGCCYLGMGNPIKEIKVQYELDGYEFVIMLAFGKARDVLHREETSDFNRKPLAQLYQGEVSQVVMEAVRLAPSATNSQPWFFTGSDQHIHVYCTKLSTIKAFFLENKNKIDMGIALCHLSVALAHESMQHSFYRDEHANLNAPKGYYYITSVTLG